MAAGELHGELRRRVRQRVRELGVAEPVAEREDRGARVEAVGPAGVPRLGVGAHRHVRHRRLVQVVLGVPCHRKLPACNKSQPKFQITNDFLVAKLCYSLPRSNIPYLKLPG